MTTDNFNDRMRERMPAHNVWHHSTTAPALSRNANDALWDEMRSRLRVYEEERRTQLRRPRIQRQMVSPSGAAIVGAAVLLVIALFELLR